MSLPSPNDSTRPPSTPSDIAAEPERSAPRRAAGATETNGVADTGSGEPDGLWAYVRSSLRNGDALLRSVSAVLVINVGGFALSYLLQVLLARWLGPAEYGLYTLAVSAAMLAAIFAALGLPSAILRFVPVYDANDEHGHLHGMLLMSRTVVFGVGLLVGLAAMGGAWALQGGDGAAPTVRALLVGFALVPLIAVMTTQQQFLRALHRPAIAYALVRVMRPALILLLVAGLWWGRPAWLGGVEAVVVAGGATLGVLAAQAFALRRALGPAVQRATRRVPWRHWMRVSLPLMLVVSFDLLVERTDVLVIGALSDAAEVGVYNAASRTSQLARFFIFAVVGVTAPQVSALYAEERHHALQQLLFRTSVLIFVPTLLVTLPLLVVPETILRLFGEEFEYGSSMLVLLSGGALFATLAGLTTTLLNVTGHQNDSALIMGCGAVFNLALNVVLVTYIGGLGAALASALTLLFMNAWMYACVVRRTGLHASFLGRPFVRSSPEHD